MNKRYLKNIWLRTNTGLLTSIPEPVQGWLKNLGAMELANHFISKSQGELIHQMNWVRVFEANKEKTRRYWEEHRYLNKIIEICRISPRSKILDIGCGISTVLHFIEGEKQGIDPLADVYKQMYEYPENIAIDQGVGEQLPYKDTSFDVCFCANALDHTDDPVKVTEEIWRVLKPNGYWILIVHMGDKEMKKDPAHPQSFTKTDVELLVGNKYQRVFKRESPAVHINQYVLGNTLKGNGGTHVKELVWVLKKL